MGSEMRTAELTLRAVILGIVLSIIFGMANAYLSLKVGMTISASIPAAVMSMAILRGLLRRGTVLENSLVQTIASSGESLAAGIIFTVPAFLILSRQGPQFAGFERFFTHFHIFLFALFGGLLGVLFLIPLRKFFVETEAKELKFPEGTACAEILKAGDAGGVQAKWVFGGLGLGALYKFFMPSEGSAGFRLLYDQVSKDIVRGSIKTRLAMDLSPALLGVGYIIGLRTALIVFAGGALGWYVLMPIISAWGAGLTAPVFPSKDLLINQMDPGQLWGYYIRYIGAGAVLAGGFITVFRTVIPVIRGTLKELKQISFRISESGDLPMGLVVIMIVLTGVAMLASPLPHNWITVLLSIVLGFLFAAVSGRLTGIVGSSSNPISGMTIASLVVISIVLVALGYQSAEGMMMALSAGAIVCITASMGGDAAQDLKTGQLVGNRPWVLQIGEFIGFLAPTYFISLTLFLLNQQAQGGIGGGQLSAPQATIISLVVKGIFERSLPWGFMAIGAALAVIVDLMRLPSLAFAVGLYLPITTTTPILLGGIIAKLRRDAERGVLIGSGLVAGDALMGIVFAGLTLGFPHWIWEKAPLISQPFYSFLLFLGFAYLIYRLVGNPSAGSEKSLPKT